MSRFVRSASWLRFLFTPAHTKQPGPVEVSDDVSLNQPYDGGGYPLYNADQWGLETTTTVVAAFRTTILTVPNDQIARILGVSAILATGVAPDCSVEVRPRSGITIGVSEQLQNVAGNRFHSFPLTTPILGPGQLLLGYHENGDAATSVTWGVFYVFAPIGTVFYL